MGGAHRPKGRSSLPEAEISFASVHSRPKASGISAKGVKTTLIFILVHFKKKSNEIIPFVS